MTPDTSELLRGVYSRVLAKTLASTRNLADAEDAVQEAIARALTRWPVDGMPEIPEAWLVRVAINAHRDRQRRRRREVPATDALDRLADTRPWARIPLDSHFGAGEWNDELLRVVFACCHPSLEPGEAAALCLTTVIGLSTSEVARAFVVETRTMEQRLNRARRRLRADGDSDGVRPGASRDRIPAVLRVFHLLFNEGYWSDHDDAPIRHDLCQLALGLARSLAGQFPTEPEALALYALLLFHDARRPARLTPDGDAVRLPDQDRSLWNRNAISEASAVLDRAITVGTPGPFQAEAAIAAIHCGAERAEDTDWTTVAALYATLERLRPSPAVRVNRAFAVARAEGPSAGLSLLDAATSVPATGDPYHALVKGTLLAELGQSEAARPHLIEARRRARNAIEAAQIDARLGSLKS